MSAKLSIFTLAKQCLFATTITEKIQFTYQAQKLYENKQLSLQKSHIDIIPITHHLGAPDKPVLVSPKYLPKRKLSSLAGKIALLHAIAHIEFNAINLAWDAIYRFQHMPQQYYIDWLSVAYDETNHFVMLNNRLQELGSEYGALDAHHGLWEMAIKTAHDVMVRMALVPRVLEARGLDVTPAMIQQFIQQDDQRSAAILKQILTEEIRHVAIGSIWFNYCCEARKLKPEETYITLVKQYFNGSIHTPLNIAAREKAGFTQKEINDLQAID